jgi:hypothetical protein
MISIKNIESLSISTRPKRFACLLEGEIFYDALIEEVIDIQN